MGTLKRGSNTECLEIKNDVGGYREGDRGEVTDSVVREPIPHPIHASITVYSNICMLRRPTLGFEQMNTSRVFDMVRSPLEVVSNSIIHPDVPMWRG